ncbi:MAG TPA: class I SAM-dependent methyltransferase [Mycobacteriales bacterium]|nr:class I SAM-dependent methyltransferase [Mycobacteriales bacterium]
MDSASFAPFYADGAPPWEIGRPQPAVIALAREGRFTGRVLDVACGTGENALHLASTGRPVLGIDGAAIAVERARAKAAERGLDAEFAVADVFDLVALGRQFDTALDSAFLHIFGDQDTRRAYTRQLAAVVPVGGWVHLLQISERSGWDTPKITSADIVDSFVDGWAVGDVRESGYDITYGTAEAWLVSMRRVSDPPAAV